MNFLFAASVEVVGKLSPVFPVALHEFLWLFGFHDKALAELSEVFLELEVAALVGPDSSRDDVGEVVAG